MRTKSQNRHDKTEWNVWRFEGLAFNLFYGSNPSPSLCIIGNSWNSVLKRRKKGKRKTRKKVKMHWPAQKKNTLLIGKKWGKGGGENYFKLDSLEDRDSRVHKETWEIDTEEGVKESSRKRRIKRSLVGWIQIEERETRDAEPFLQTRFRRGNFSTERSEKNGQFVIVSVGVRVGEGEAEGGDREHQ